ncbi:hypothetical protein BDN71DRAFT_436709 [Pleurotus eryngii]|uniref:Uncharacterized protein n=1 Tax=Pleurotus eryngii TaxID=5323 RepID=A0A9P6DHK9_PLEER|nr:hypothetical protein BDN71DRAFT_436709 [Pleurotus eryngii]
MNTFTLLWSAALPLRRASLRSTLRPTLRRQPLLLRQYGTPFRPTTGRWPPLRTKSSSPSRTPSSLANAGSMLSSFSMMSYLRFLGIGIGIVTLGTFYMKYLSILQIVDNLKASVSTGLATVKIKTEALVGRVKGVNVPDEIKNSISAVSEAARTKSGELGKTIREAKASGVAEVVESVKGSASTMAEVVRVKSEELGTTLKDPKTAESVRSSVSVAFGAVKAKSQELGARVKEGKGMESVEALFKRDKDK